ncbi:MULTISPECIES: SIR2 family protein [Microbacterium]|uniref:SIR2 family NAD-dependent protein deacylase n=1 Tax=Microbacterium TaxID=33882 RepID=UPI0027804CA3|nr:MULTISPECIES: SIR2 family protein [Microbacterium]MDQ1083909.1 hypothetical protein [Microbacterium sp. SORGH_AS_0344]MDQ1170811.1 hypothetical protein [Microbacterium proteolyticum]
MDAKARLVNAIASQEVIVVTGTGVTMALTGGAETSTWMGLIRDGVARAKLIDVDAATILEFRLEHAKTADDLIGIAHDLKRTLGADFGRWLALSVGALPLKSPRLAQAIAGLGAPIMTTNYDQLLEKALGRGSATWSRPSDMREVIRRESRAIGHLHGVYNDLASVVFSQGDYQRITADDDAQATQTAAFSIKTFLFIGVGDGLTDPNFSPMVTAFEQRFPSSAHTHFRLCVDGDVDPASDLKSVVDVGYGSRHDDLASFLEGLVDPATSSHAELGAKSRRLLLDALRDNSTLWRDTETLNEKSIKDLVVPPIFLPEPHDQYVNSAVLNAEKDKPTPLDLAEKMSEGGIIIIAGEESSGVSTALGYSLSQALDLRPLAHALLVKNPTAAGVHPVARVVERAYRDWGVGSPPQETQARLILGVDNLRYDESSRFQKALSDIVASPAALKIVGVRQGDAVIIANLLKEQTDVEVTVVFLGRFSDGEARELARRVAPGREDKVASYVMVVIREKNLPRTPFTITLLVDLVQSGVLLQKQESEIAVLDQYLDLLLNTDYVQTASELTMTVRNKRLVLELLARRFVEKREDKGSEPEITEWLRAQFEELGWDHNVQDCVNDLVDRRVLARSAETTLRFQRSAYLELMAGIAARDDAEFRALVFQFPIQLASIVRTYTAMTRNAVDVLDVVEREIKRIAIAPPTGGIFSSIRKMDARHELFSDDNDAETERDHAGEGQSKGDGVVERKGLTGSYYDDSSDSDSPAFLTTRIEDLSEARVAMLVVDLASRVLRDSDEVRDQELKERILKKVLVAWVAFADLWESEMAGIPDLDDVVSTFLGEDADDEEEVERLKLFLIKLLPSIITAAGIRYCLSGPGLATRLVQLKLDDVENGGYAGLMRTLALLQAENRRWVETLDYIDETSLKTFFSVSFFSALARRAYLTATYLTDSDRDKIRDFLRKVIEARYNFDSVQHRNKVLNDFEAKLRRDRLDKNRPRLAIEL